MSPVQRLRVIDSHTGGEPTRLVIDGAPALRGGSMAERLTALRDRHDWLRKTVVTEPRGSDVLVGGLLCPPTDPACAAGVIFFNNVGYLGMCGHGTIGLVVTLAHLGRLSPGRHRIETPVGVVTATLHRNRSVSVENVPSHRKARAVKVRVPGFGTVAGDIAWGGNWFFLVRSRRPALTLANHERLTEFAWAVRQAVNCQGFPEVDHVELFGTARAGGDARNFVLCPGRAYDRSPCGTGTSAKLACLAADRKLVEGATWVQESIVGSTFTARYRWLDRQAGTILPVITGSAHVTAEATLLVDPRDPFRHGLPTR